MIQVPHRQVCAQFPLLVSLICIASLTSLSDAAFERVSIGARPLGMGTAFTALADDVNAVQWNPAGLVSVDTRQMDLSYLDLYGLVGYSTVAVVLPSETGGWGFGLMGSDDVEGLYQEMALLASTAYPITPTISAGGTLHYLSSQATTGDVLIGRGRGLALDVGFQATFLDEDLILAVSAPQLLSYVSYHRESVWRGPEVSYTEGAAREFRLGASYRTYWHRPLRLATEWTNSGTWKAGLEILLAQPFRLRAGLRLGAGLDQGWSAGFGYRAGIFQLDYAYASGRFGVSTSQMSLRFYY